MTIKRLITVGRTDTPQAVSKAFTAVESAINKIGDTATAKLPERMDAAESAIEALQAETAKLEDEIDTTQHKTLSASGFLDGQPYNGSEDHIWTVNGTPETDPTTLVARDANGASKFAEVFASATDHELVSLERKETAADKFQFIVLSRDGTVHGIIGLDDHDRLCLFKADGSTVYSYLDDVDGTWYSVFLKTQSLFDQDGNQVVTHQQAAIPNVAATTGSPPGSDSTGGSPSDPATLGDVQGAYNVTNALQARIADLEGSVATLIGGLNTVLGMLRSHGLIAP